MKFCVSTLHILCISWGLTPSLITWWRPWSRYLWIVKSLLDPVWGENCIKDRLLLSHDLSDDKILHHRKLTSPQLTPDPMYSQWARPPPWGRRAAAWTQPRIGRDVIAENPIRTRIGWEGDLNGTSLRYSGKDRFTSIFWNISTLGKKSHWVTVYASD